jgi:predicted nuclease of restriction endonuclease-like (RecB) superfamily
MTNIIGEEYKQLLADLKFRVAHSRYKATLSANREMLHLYHYVGNKILTSQKTQGWGAKIIQQLSRDLRSEFSDMKGFSPQNLKYMKRFAEEYSFDEMSQQLVDQLPWGHNILLMYDIKDKEERQFYIKKLIEHGWSRDILSMQIETNLYQREGKAITNFTQTLPAVQSELAKATLRNPYLFDFLSLGKNAHEREVEKSLVNHIQRFLIELGEGFAFLGSQYYLKVEGEEFYLDLLFYNIKLRSFLVIDLKSGKFKPEYAGKMNFYLSAVDDLLRHPSDNPSIGLILCRSEVGVLAEYALRDINKPIGLAEYRLTEQLPKEIKTLLPTIEELEVELSKKYSDDEEVPEEAK